MTEPEFEASRQRQKGGGESGVTILNALICRKSEILDIFLSRSRLIARGGRQPVAEQARCLWTAGAGQQFNASAERPSGAFRSLGDDPCAASIACWTNDTISAQ